jgi:hypothetical protein
MKREFKNRKTAENFTLKLMKQGRSSKMSIKKCKPTYVVSYRKKVKKR